MNAIEAAFIAFVATEPELRTSAVGKPWLSFNAGVGEGDARHAMGARRLL